MSSSVTLLDCYVPSNRHVYAHARPPLASALFSARRVNSRGLMMTANKNLPDPPIIYPYLFESS